MQIDFSYLFGLFSLSKCLLDIDKALDTVSNLFKLEGTYYLARNTLKDLSHERLFKRKNKTQDKN